MIEMIVMDRIEESMWYEREAKRPHLRYSCSRRVGILLKTQSWRQKEQ